MSDYRYCYHSREYIASGAQHGVLCNPVFLPNGKCCVGKGKQWVVFEDGKLATVIRRALRMREKCRVHGGHQ